MSYNLKQFIEDSSSLKPNQVFEGDKCPEMFDHFRSFIEDSDTMLRSIAKNVIDDLRTATKDPWDSSQVANFYESFSRKSREEDLSNKLAWYLDLHFVRDNSLRIKIQKEIFSSLETQLAKRSSRSLKKFPEFNELTISREITSQRTGQRLDLRIENEIGLPILGIEVKVLDTKYLKSNNDHEDMLNENPDASFWLLLREDQFENIEEELLQQLTMPIILWEELYQAIRVVVAKYGTNDQFKVFSEMFLSSIESHALEILPFGLGQQLDTLSITSRKISQISRYLTFRQSYGVANGEN